MMGYRLGEMGFMIQVSETALMDRDMKCHLGGSEQNGFMMAFYLY